MKCAKETASTASPNYFLNLHETAPTHTHMRNNSYFFSQTERNILKSVCAYMVGVAHDTTLDKPLGIIDKFVSELPKALQIQLRFGLHVFQWGPPVFIGKPRLFTQLAPHDAVKYIETWAGSRLGMRRLLFRGLRDIAFLGYYSSPQKKWKNE